LFLVFAYVLVDLADPFPGAFEFDADESVEAIDAARPGPSARPTAERDDPAIPHRRTPGTPGVAHASARARRPQTDWLALSRPAHALRGDPVAAAPSEDH
jgi:hypothetical protein